MHRLVSLDFGFEWWELHPYLSPIDSDSQGFLSQKWKKSGLEKKG